MNDPFDRSCSEEGLFILELERHPPRMLYESPRRVAESAYSEAKELPRGVAVSAHHVQGVFDMRVKLHPAGPSTFFAVLRVPPKVMNIHGPLACDTEGHVFRLQAL